MRYRYLRALVIYSGLLIMLLWCIILTQPIDSPRRDAYWFDILPSDISSTKPRYSEHTTRRRRSDNSDAKHVAKTEMKHLTKSGVKHVVKSDTKHETKSETKHVIKSDMKLVIKPDSKHVTKRKHLTKTDTIDVTKSETKTLTKSDMKHAAKPVSKSCNGTVFPFHLLQEESWNVIDEAKNTFVFSAYVVDTSGKIKGVGASVKPAANVYCQYWYKTKENPTIRLDVNEAIVHILPEGYGNKYSGAVFECSPTSKLVSYVSFVARKCDTPLHLLIVKNAVTPTKYQRKYTLCLSPLHVGHGPAQELVEWIEFNKILGAEKIVIYNYSIVIEKSVQVLEHYAKQRFIEIVQWNLPMISNTWPKTNVSVEIHSIGILPMLQDCLFRSKAHSEFVVNLDVNEFIIPRTANIFTWPEMMSQMPPNAEVYLFRNTFFRKDWHSPHVYFPEERVARKLKIITMQTFERENEVFEAGTWSKYFGRTSADKSLMIHDVPGSNSYVVPVEVGLLHHYKNWQKFKNTVMNRVIDYTVLRKYAENLTYNIQSTWKQLGVDTQGHQRTQY